MLLKSAGMAAYRPEMLGCKFEPLFENKCRAMFPRRTCHEAEVLSSHGGLRSQLEAAQAFRHLRRLQPDAHKESIAVRNHIIYIGAPECANREPYGNMINDATTVLAETTLVANDQNAGSCTEVRNRRS